MKDPKDEWEYIVNTAHMPDVTRVQQQLNSLLAESGLKAAECTLAVFGEAITGTRAIAEMNGSTPEETSALLHHIVDEFLVALNHLDEEKSLAPWAAVPGTAPSDLN